MLQRRKTIQNFDQLWQKQYVEIFIVTLPCKASILEWFFLLLVQTFRVFTSLQGLAYLK